ncbi:MAG: hypothetical protein LBB34_02670, partial [Holosporales bacterium]|jgi:hypothetical protein|nr:hypothetical protein [Holosporales bacterium]
VIRIVRKTDLNINQAPLMLKFFSEELKQRLDASTASFMECLWQSDEQFEVITGKKLQGEGFFALSEVSYALGKGEPLCYLRAFGVSMIPYEGGGKLEAGKDLVQYYEGTDLVEFLGGRRIPPITRKVYADSLFASREVLYELQQGERRKKVKHPYLKLLGL